MARHIDPAAKHAHVSQLEDTTLVTKPFGVQGVDIRPAEAFLSSLGKYGPRQRLPVPSLSFGPGQAGCPSPVLGSDDRANLISDFLKLPDLTAHQHQLKEFLQQEAIKHAESAHDLTRASQRDPIIIDRFRTFAAEEVAVSGASQESLICPWGSLGSRLHIRLHCPSLLGYSKGYADSVLHQFHGSTDNAVAPSIALLASKGMIGDPQTLVSEASYRAEPTHNRANRNGRARFPEDYGPNLRAIHQAFAEWIWDSSQAGVVLLFGCENERRFLERFSQAVLFRIPGFEVVTGRGYLILDEYSNVSRIVICASHPEHTIRFATYVQAMQQDHLLNLAAALSDIPSEVRSAWCTQVKQACLMRLCDHANQLSTVQDILAILQWEARGGVVSLDMCPPNVHDLMEHSHGGEGKSTTRRLLELLERLCPAEKKSDRGRCLYVLCNKRAGEAYQGYCSAHWKVQNPGMKMPALRCKFDDCDKARQSNCTGYCIVHFAVIHGRRHGVSCKVEGCTKRSRPGSLQGYCAAHYRSVHGKIGSGVCKFQDCDKSKMGQCGGYCAAHYKMLFGQRQGLLCKVAECRKERRVNGYCHAHNRAVTGSFAKNYRCKADGCPKARVGLCEGFCREHFRSTAGIWCKGYGACKTRGCSRWGYSQYGGHCRAHHPVAAAGALSLRCRVEGCSRQGNYRYKGVCIKHRENGPSRAGFINRPSKVCRVEGCVSRGNNRFQGVCKRHRLNM